MPQYFCVAYERIGGQAKRRLVPYEAADDNAAWRSPLDDVPPRGDRLIDHPIRRDTGKCAEGCCSLREWSDYARQWAA